MRKQCAIKGCSAPFTLCLKNPAQEYQTCEEFDGNAKIDDQSLLAAGEGQGGDPSIILPWQGGVFQPADIGLVSARNSPYMIGMVGTKDAGKTSYLGMLYTLLFRGKKFVDWNFAGSQTLAGWELPAKYLKIRPDGTTQFPPPTSSNPAFYSLYHLALKNGKGTLADVLFADSSGEVFTKWSINPDDPEAQNAAWIYDRASGFILFVDCVALIERRGEVKQEIVQIAEQISHNLKGRPVTIAWSKADRIAEIRPKIRESLEEDLDELLPHAKVLLITNFPQSDAEPMCHLNNLATAEFLINQLAQPKEKAFSPLLVSGDDFFLNYPSQS